MKVAELTAANDALSAALTAQERKLAAAVDQLRRQLKVEVERGDIDIIQYRDVMIVNIKDSIGFQPDSAVLRPEFGPILTKVAEAFSSFPDKVIRVEGHTAVAPSRWSNSWDLGAARAVGVVRYLQERAGVDPTRLVALSFGEHRPLEPNLTEEQRKRNRRVEIVLVDRPLYQVNEIINSGK